jgi:hypothetical protein
MTTALALPALLRCQLLDQGLVIPPDLTFEEWEYTLNRAEWIERASPWWVVDLIAFGRAKFHEDYSQALPDAIEDADGFHQAKLKQAEWMADRWPPSTRVPEQSYSAHRAVAKLDHADAVALLQETDKEGRRLPVRTLIKRATEIEESIRGRVVAAVDAPVEDAPSLPLSVADLTDEARAALEYRAAGVGKRHRQGFEAGWVAALIWGGVDAFTREAP